ncbi:hypothetical protein ACFUJR_02630 [Streptomyces sp. NPDC057271]|uniref:hypothetical protein n=1 Tax=unclassified Streptomyces TaxID=2593676 RepID=UPI0036344972
MTHRTRSERTWVTVAWAGPIQVRTLYDGADLIHVDDPAPAPTAPEELHMAYADGFRE